MKESCCRNILVKEGRKPGSVPCSSYPKRGDDHSSRSVVANGLKQPNPGTLNEPFLSVPLFGLAPDGVYRASDVTAGTGELLPHPFTLTSQRLAVFSLWHFPWGHPRFPLGTILLCGARTFLPPSTLGQQAAIICPSSTNLYVKRPAQHKECGYSAGRFAIQKP